MFSTASYAQTNQWRTNYAAARKEAAEKGLPLILDFGTSACYWCKRLEVDTFSVDSVSRIMNKQFIPLKINAEVETTLNDALQVRSYPTIILADSDGKILSKIEGFQEAPQFQENLLRALAQVANPPWMIRDFQTASKALNTPDYPKAITLLKNIMEDGKSRPIQKKAQQLLNEIEKQAATQLAKARQLSDNGQTLNSADVLANLVRKYPGTQAAAEAGNLLVKEVKTPEVIVQTRTQQARQLLGEAKQFYKSEKYFLCLQRCKTLKEEYGDLEEGKEAYELDNAIRGNPVWMEKTCQELNEQIGDLYLSLARTYQEKGQRQKAMTYLQKVIHTCPNTTYSEVAEIRLGQLQGQPTLQVEFKKK